MQTYRAPTSTVARNDFAPRGNSAFGGNAFSGYSAKSEHSGGFHLFGSGHSSENSWGGGHAPKSFGSAKGFSSHSGGGGFHMFGGGHSSGGGHSGGHGGGGHHH